MEGLFIDGRRPKSKKEVKDVAANEPERMEIEQTSMFGGGGTTALVDIAPGVRFDCVGPDPHTSRKFYLNLEKLDSGRIKVT